MSAKCYSGQKISLKIGVKCYNARTSQKNLRRAAGNGRPPRSSVPSMALILLVKVQSRVFTAKCSEPQVGTSNGMDEGSGVTKFLSLRTET